MNLQKSLKIRKDLVICTLIWICLLNIINNSYISKDDSKRLKENKDIKKTFFL